jgi:hypothetical protein
MIGEIDLHGVLDAPLLAWIVVAYAVSVPIRWALGLCGFYRLVWHRALFDAALFVVLVGAVNVAAIHWLAT